MQRAKQCLIIDVNRDQGMTEKAWRLSIACRPQTPPPTIPSAEIDLGGVLDRYNSSSSTGSRCSLACCPENLLWRNISRSQKTMGRQLSGPIASKLAYNQRASGHDPLEECHSRTFPTHITKKSDPIAGILIHPCLLAFAPQAVNQAGKLGGTTKSSRAGY